MTDGLENCSKEYNQEDFKKIREKLEKKGNWTFTFMGAGQDAWATASAMGIQVGNTMQWEATRGGVKDAMRGFGAQTVAYAAMVGQSADMKAMNTSSFFDNKADEKSTTDLPGSTK